MSSQSSKRASEAPHYERTDNPTKKISQPSKSSPASLSPPPHHPTAAHAGTSKSPSVHDSTLETPSTDGLTLKAPTAGSSSPAPASPTQHSSSSTSAPGTVKVALTDEERLTRKDPFQMTSEELDAYGKAMGWERPYSEDDVVYEDGDEHPDLDSEYNSFINSQRRKAIEHANTDEERLTMTRDPYQMSMEELFAYGRSMGWDSPRRGVVVPYEGDDGYPDLDYEYEMFTHSNPPETIKHSPTDEERLKMIRDPS